VVIARRCKTLEDRQLKIAELVQNIIKTRDTEKLLRYLLKSSFLVDPASGEYHNNFEGGLFEHCLNVNYMAREVLLPAMIKFNSGMEEITEESIFLVAITHDFCKVGRYKPDVPKWYKDDFDKWQSYMTYGYNDDPFPMGHGTKSAFIASELIKLTTVETLAIQHHMHFSEMGNFFGEQKMNFNAAFTHPFVKLMAMADFNTNLLEQAVDYKVKEFKTTKIDTEFLTKIREI
jgi:hypothetical protein